MRQKTPIEIPLPTTFYVDGKMMEYQEETMLPLNIGDGILWNDGRRWRVVDRWLSYDHHGHTAWACTSSWSPSRSLARTTRWRSTHRTTSGRSDG